VGSELAKHGLTALATLGSREDLGSTRSFRLMPPPEADSEEEVVILATRDRATLEPIVARLG
jgi:hypothetical protein